MTTHSLIKCFSILALLTSCNLRSADDYLLESNSLASKGKFKEAISLLNKAIEKYPKFREAYLNRGVYCEELKDFNSAIKSYQDLLKIDDKNTAALYYIGNCKSELNLFQDAIDYYIRALQTKGYSLNNDTSGITNIIINWNKNGIGENAKFDILSTEIFYQRGLAYYQLDKLRNAVNDFSYCLKQYFHVPDCHYMIALCYLESGNKVKGCSELDKAIFYGDTLARKKKQEVCN